MTVRVHLGGGNYADLEPDLYEVDRSLLEDGPRSDGTVSGDDTAGSADHNLAAPEVGPPALEWAVVNVVTGDRAEAETFDAVLLAARTLVDDHVRAGGDRRSARLGSTVLHVGVYHNDGTRQARLGWS